MPRRIMGGRDREAGMRRLPIFEVAFLSRFEIRFGSSVERGADVGSLNKKRTSAAKAALHSPLLRHD
jgi:hypothetical protein